jgi:iron complex transport system permease protein
LILLGSGVLLVALVTAAAGPIAFVALAAPQLAMRITGTPGVRIVPAAAVGALLLVSSDLIARTIIAPAQLPVGVVTLCLGGAYLVWLLGRSGRRARG